ncbi:MAG TPA: hypothetical protein PLL26_02710 [Candidatus Dojkabacteria bacterium]|nr:hypothetical protein [Candidatus Dojkabacteria bacterium]
MIGKEVLEIEGKTILKITAFDHTRYDKGITIKFDDGSSIDINPILIQGPDSRIKYNFQEGPNDDLRRDICKCGGIITWNTDDNNGIVSCPSCKTSFKVEFNDQLVYWLKESLEDRKPWTTAAK